MRTYTHTHAHTHKHTSHTHTHTHLHDTCTHTHTQTTHCPFCFFINLSTLCLVILTGKLECELHQFKHNLGLLYTDVQDNS